MDTNMEDVGRVSTELAGPSNLEPTTIPTLDGWIESLMNCKQLAEADVQRLCEKVRSMCHGSLSAILVQLLAFHGQRGFDDRSSRSTCCPSRVLNLLLDIVADIAVF
jgi:hypothetical protein